MSSILVSYNEARDIVYSRIRSYISAMAAKEVETKNKLNLTDTQKNISGYLGELIPDTVAYVTFEDDVPATDVIYDNGVECSYTITPDESELNKFFITTPKNKKYTTIIPTEAFDSYSDVEYEAYIKKTYDKKLVEKAKKARDDEKKLIEDALTNKLANFDSFISSIGA